MLSHDCHIKLKKLEIKVLLITSRAIFWAIPGYIMNRSELTIIQFSLAVFLFPPLVEQNTYINIITLRKKQHATKRNNVETCKNSINYTS